jgi:hypothetical protein
VIYKLGQILLFNLCRIGLKTGAKILSAAEEEDVHIFSLQRFESLMQKYEFVGRKWILCLLYLPMYNARM